jgi:hypothetical protein
MEVRTWSSFASDFTRAGEVTHRANVTGADTTVPFRNVAATQRTEWMSKNGRDPQPRFAPTSLVIPRVLPRVQVMQQHPYTTVPRMRSGLRSRLILPAAIAEVRAALEARVAQAPDDLAARVSLGELNLSVCLAATARADSHAKDAAHAPAEPTGAPAPDLLRARHVVPNLAAMAPRTRDTVRPGVPRRHD